MRTLFISITLLCFHVYVQAQETIPIETVQSSTLGDSISSVDANRLSETTDLLPEHYLFTQRLLWSEKGLMRNIPVFELSQSSRDLEMDIRSYATRKINYQIKKKKLLFLVLRFRNENIHYIARRQL